MKFNQLDPDAAKRSGLPAYHIASVGRALSLLASFSDRDQLTVSEAAELLDVAPSTAHRLLQMLVFHGFAEQDDRRAYVRGPAIGALSSGSRPGAELETAVRPLLAELRDKLEGTVHLLSLEGNGARFGTGVAAYEEDRIASLRTGWLLPAHTLAGGKALLAALDGEQIAALYPDGVPLTRHGRIRSMAQLHRRLGDIRERGFAVSREAHRNVCAIGVAVPSVDGSTSMALSVAWPAEVFPLDDAQRALKRIRATARELAETIGYRA